jgi:hypothetical protein
LNAISVVQENIDTGVKIRSKVGLFRSALTWIIHEQAKGEIIAQI